MSHSFVSFISSPLLKGHLILLSHILVFRFVRSSSFTVIIIQSEKILNSSKDDPLCLIISREAYTQSQTELDSVGLSLPLRL